MIRQFLPGVWIDPEDVVAVDGSDYMVHVMCLIGGRVNRVPIRAVDDVHAVALANEIGNAARIAQEARLAADTRLRSPMQCPECGSAERIGLGWPTDTAGRSE